MTLKLCTTGEAAAYSSLPGCTACMLQVPAVARVAAEPPTIQTAGVVEIKLTGNPELAVAASVRVEAATCVGIDPKLIVCVVVPVPTPFNWMFCTA